jgi:hypothetical protein
VLRANHFISGKDQAQAMHRYVALYNHQLFLSKLASNTDAGDERLLRSPSHWFRMRPDDRPGCDR